jgi:hypothetical protein
VPTEGGVGEPHNHVLNLIDALQTVNDVLDFPPTQLRLGRTDTQSDPGPFTRSPGIVSVLQAGMMGC